MQSDVLTVSPETLLLDIHSMFVEEEIHGAPVVDDDGRVRGVVSTLDLLRGADEPDARKERFGALTAADVMTRELVSVAPSATLDECAQTMREQHIHRVLVIEEGELVGVLTTFDLLRVFVRDDRAVALRAAR